MSTNIVSLNGSDIYHDTVGSGAPVLIMHGGLGLSHDYLRPYFDRLAQEHTVIYYDHFGNGRSGRPDDFAEMTFDRLVSDAAALMDHLGHGRFVLIGHSYGGFIAQAFAARYPDRLNGLVLVDTVPVLDYQPPVAGPDELMAAFGKLFSEPMADDADWQDTWGKVIQLYFHKWDDATGTDLDARTRYEHRAWNAAGAMLGSYNLLEDLPKLTVPTLAMAGAHDGITPPEPGAHRIGSLVPNAQVAVFDNSGHYPFIEEEEVFFRKLNEWLSAL